MSFYVSSRRHVRRSVGNNNWLSCETASHIHVPGLYVSRLAPDATMAQVLAAELSDRLSGEIDRLGWGCVVWMPPDHLDPGMYDIMGTPYVDVVTLRLGTPVLSVDFEGGAIGICGGTALTERHCYHSLDFALLVQRCVDILALSVDGLLRERDCLAGVIGE